MKASFLKIPVCENSCFLAREFKTPFVETPWHYHEEYELALVKEGRGKCFIGDHVREFEPGFLVFMAPNLPHLYKKLVMEPEMKMNIMVIQFSEDFLSKKFLEIPEMEKVQVAFTRSRLGLEILGEARDSIIRDLEDILKQKGMERLITLFSILNKIANAKESRTLCSQIVSRNDVKDIERLNTVYQFVSENFKNKILIKDLAERINISESAFSRYFKNQAKKSFSGYLNEVRIGHACQLLTETDLEVLHICYESGFNNPANFNKQFKKMKKTSPLKFRHLYRKNNY